MGSGALQRELEPVVGEREAFEAFYRREYPRMVALALAVAGSHLIAEDLAQEAMLRAYRHWDRVGRYDRPGAWLRRVTVNLSSNALRRARLEVKVRILEAARRPGSIPPPELPDEQVWRAVRALPARQRAAVALFYLEGKSVAEIAEILGCAEGTAKAHLHKARRALAARLEAGRSSP